MEMHPVKQHFAGRNVQLLKPPYITFYFNVHLSSQKSIIILFPFKVFLNKQSLIQN